MTGSPATRPAPDPPAGPRAALVIATASYQDPELRQLRAPVRDADDLAVVLGDADVGRLYRHAADRPGRAATAAGDRRVPVRPRRQ